jgi:hypothetical protein
MIPDNEPMRRARALAVLAVALAAAVLVGGGSSSAVTGPCGGSTVHPTKVLWVWMENHSYSQIIGSSSAPYENSLASQCGLATNYHAIRHPSLPNYLAATSGSTHGITTDCSPSSCPISGPSIFGQSTSTGSYEQSMKSNCQLTNSYPYAYRHNPQLYYTAQRAHCRHTNRPMGTVSSGALRSRLNAGTLRRFSFITPNVCDDTHDCLIKTGDNWLRALLPVIFAAPDYSSGQLAVVLVWDEASGDSSNHVAAIVASKHTAPGTRSGTRFNHYGLLRTTERILGWPLLGSAKTATSMRSAFGL